MPAAAADEEAPKRGRLLIAVLPYLLDVLVPTVGYYVLVACGLSQFWALVLAGVITAPVAIFNTVKRRKLDMLGVLVVLEIALGIILAFGFNDPRITLARGSISIALGAIWVLVMNLTGRPLSVNATKPLAYNGNPNRVIAFDWCADNSKRFLRIHRVLSMIWAIAFLAYAVLRVVIVYGVRDISESVWMSDMPFVAAIVICLAASAVAGRMLGGIVDARTAEIEKTAATA